MSGYNVIQWYDTRLHWDQKAFPGIRKINIDPELVWRPGTVFYNAKGKTI